MFLRGSLILGFGGILSLVVFFVLLGAAGTALYLRAVRIGPVACVATLGFLSMFASLYALLTPSPNPRYALPAAAAARSGTAWWS